MFRSWLRRVGRSYSPTTLPRVILSDAAWFIEKLGLQPLFDLNVETIHVDQGDDPVIATHRCFRIATECVLKVSRKISLFMPPKESIVAKFHCSHDAYYGETNRAVRLRMTIQQRAPVSEDLHIWPRESLIDHTIE